MRPVAISASTERADVGVSALISLGLQILRAAVIYKEVMTLEAITALGRNLLNS